MKAKYQLICMSFDGEYKREHQEFETIQDAWDYSNDLGSKWYFYPFHFVVKGKTIADSTGPLDIYVGKRIKTVAKRFESLSKIEEAQGMGVEEFAFYVA
jgi:hypothetical protein